MLEDNGQAVKLLQLFVGLAIGKVLDNLFHFGRNSRHALVGARTKEDVNIIGREEEFVLLHIGLALGFQLFKPRGQ